MSDLMILKQLPPAIPKRIVQFLIVTDEKLEERRAQLRAVRRLQAGSDQYNAVLRDVQRMDELKTIAELRLGQLLKEIEKNKGGRPPKTRRTERQDSLADQGITRDLSSESQLMANNEKVVYETIDELRDTDNQHIHREVIRRIRARRRRPAKLPPLPEGKFTVILADPPWPQDGNRLEALSVDEICEMGLRIKKIADDGCLLFLWVAAPMTGSFKRVIDAWGFRYGGQLLWVKDHSESVIRHENLILGGKDRAALSVIEKQLVRRVDSVLVFPEMEASVKPEAFYEMAEDLSERGSRIELFAHGHRADWVSWGLGYDADGAERAIEPRAGSGCWLLVLVEQLEE